MMLNICCIFFFALITSALGRNDCRILRRADGTSEVLCANLKAKQLPIDEIFLFEDDYPGFTLNLRRLEFKDCEFKEIRRDTFKLFPILSQLIISNASLENIENGAFQGIKRLKYLDLSQNHLTEIPSFLKVGLRHLNLNENPGLAIPTNGPLVPQEHLEWLSLQKCRIHHLPGSAFSRNKFISHLDLSFNRLEQLPDGIFSKNKFLKFIDLSNNHFKKLNDIVFRNIPGYPTGIEKIIVANNPWHCDCSLAPLITWLTADTETHFPTTDAKRSRSHKDTICASPQKYAGQSWFHLKEWSCNN